MKRQRILFTAAAILVVALLGAIGGWLVLEESASAQSSLPAPGNVIANQGEDRGDVAVSWDTVAEASGYTVAWVHLDAAWHVYRGGGNWHRVVQSVDVEANSHSLTVNGLTPGIGYAFRVGATNDAANDPSWSDWIVQTPEGAGGTIDVHDVVRIQSAALGVAKHANALAAVGAVPTFLRMMQPGAFSEDRVAIDTHVSELETRLEFLQENGPEARVTHINGLVDRLMYNVDAIQAGREPLAAALIAEGASREHLVLSSATGLFPATDASVDRQFYDLATNVNGISEADILRYAHTNSLYASAGLGHTLLVTASLLQFPPHVAAIQELYDSVAGRIERDVEYLRDDPGAGLDHDLLDVASRLRDAQSAEGQNDYFGRLVERLELSQQENALIAENSHILGQILDQVDALAAEVQGLEAPEVPQMRPVDSTDPGITANEIHFGQSAVLSGQSAELGIGMRLGIRAAFEEANRQGGVHGRLLKLTTLDDGYETEGAFTQTQRLIDSERVFALIGEVGTPTSRAALPLAQANGVPFIGAFTGAQLLRGEDHTNVLNYRASYYEETEKMVELLDEAGVTRVAVLYQIDSYGIDGLNGVKLALDSRDNMDLVDSWYYLRNTDAVQAAAFRLGTADQEPEAVIIIGTHEPAARLIEKLRMKIGSDTIFMAVSFVGSVPLAEELGDAVDNVYVTQVVPLPTDRDNPVVASYLDALAEVDAVAGPGFVSLEGYLAGRLAIERLEACGANVSRACFLDVFGASTPVEIDNITLEFGPNDNQGSDQVFLTRIGADGEYEEVDHIGANP